MSGINKSSSIQRRVILMLLLSLATALLLFTMALHSIMLKSIDELEKNEARTNIISVMKTIEADYNRLSSISHDWATWDDSYDFITSSDPEFHASYIADNLYDDIFINLSVNMLVFVDNDKHLVHAAAYDLDSSRKAIVSALTLEKLLSLNALDIMDPGNKISGMIMTPDGPLILAVAPITRSSGAGPVAGHFIIGRFLTENKIKEIEETLDTKLTLDSLNGTFPQDDSGSKDINPVYTVLDGDKLRTTIAIKDLDGQSILHISADEPRNAHLIGVAGVRSATLALLVIGILLFISVTTLMNRLIIRRLKNMAKAIRKIGDSGSINDRLETDSHSDELSTIVDSINGTLKKLSNANNLLYMSEKRYRTLVEAGNDVIFMWDDCGRFIYTSPNCMKILGYSSNQLMGNSFEDLLSESDIDHFKHLLEDYFESGKADWEFSIMTGNGLFRWFRISVSPTTDPETDKTSHIGIMSDIEERKSAEIALQGSYDNLENLVTERTNELMRVNAVLQEEQETIKYLAYHDHLTGLPNHLLFKEFLDRSIATSNRTGKPLAVFLVDLDYFKMINDTLGHVAGDQLLVAVAERLSRTLRKTDVIARIGGDEFNIMIDEIESDKAPITVANKILSAFDKPLYINGQECFLSSSIGVSIFPIDGNDAVTLIKNADLAMYKAKDRGRNQTCYCTTEMKEQVVENMMLSNQLWRALERKELEVYYQPQVNVATNTIVGSEALIRWHHKDLGMISPSKFIPLAEQTGSINAIGEWIMFEACRQNLIWQKRFNPDLRIAVNLSVKQLHHIRIIDVVKRVLSETGIRPSTVELEITETMAMKEIQYIIDILKQLKTLGVDLAIDDFGTEYSSMNYLKELPVDRIKLAMPFVQGIHINDKDEAIAKAVIILAKSMGMNIIAEGVETQDQFDFLAQKMCDETQGFYFYRPMPADQMEKVLSEQYERLD